jgi:hypothetical protein
MAVATATASVLTRIDASFRARRARFPANAGFEGKPSDG